MGFDHQHMVRFDHQNMGSQMSQGFQGHWQMQLQLAGPCWPSLFVSLNYKYRAKDPNHPREFPRNSWYPLPEESVFVEVFLQCQLVETAWKVQEGPARFQLEVSTLWKVCPRKNHLLATFVQTKPGANGGHLKLGDPLGWVSSNAKDVFAEAWQQDNHLLQGFWCVTSKISKHPNVKATPLLALRKHPYPNSQVQSSSPSIKFIATQLK